MITGLTALKSGGGTILFKSNFQTQKSHKMEQFKIRGAIGGRTIEATVNANTPEEATEYFVELYRKATRVTERKIEIIEVESQGIIAGYHVGLAKGSTINIA